MLHLSSLPIPTPEPWNLPYEVRLERLRREGRQVAYYSDHKGKPTFRYRGLNMIEAIDALQVSISASCFFASDIEAQRYDWLDGLSVLVISRSIFQPLLQNLVSKARQRGVRIFYDIDDFVIDREHVISIMSLLDVDVVDQRIEYWENTIDQHRKALLLCDEVITTNPYLKKRIEESTGKVCHAINNFLDRHQLMVSNHLYEQKVAQKFTNRDEFITLGYFSGSSSHNRDFALVSPAILALMRRDRRIRLRVGGQIQLADAFRAVSDRVEILEMCDYIKLQSVIGAVEFNLAPVQNGVFSHCKSQLKYFEAAICGSVTLASPTHCFASAITHGVNGYLSPSHLWLETLEEVVNLPYADYVKVAMNSRKHAFENFHFGQYGESILNTLGIGSAEVTRAQLQLSTQIQEMGGASYLGRFSSEIPQALATDVKQENLSLNLKGEDVILVVEDLGSIEFSVILPTKDRKKSIGVAIDSLLRQTLQSFELVIIDDGSTDGTYEYLQEVYASEFSSGRFVIKKFERNVGVCRARNLGLETATKPWIAYLDSDNQLRPHFLESFARAIRENPNSRTFYGKHKNIESGFYASRPYDEEFLKLGNYMDLGVFVHHRTLFEELGGFDVNLKRLVDWDLIVSYTKKDRPYFINEVLMLYNDSDDGSRISKAESILDARIYMDRKLGLNRPVVSTIILSYQHKEFIGEAIQSALAQSNKVIHDIIISDDGSTDGTKEIIRHYANHFCDTIRLIEVDGNVGISENFRRCFAAAKGEFIAVLEGDDVWTDRDKLFKQAEFLRNHPQASMVFSKIEVLNAKSGLTSTLKRQDDIRSELLSAQDFLNDASLNLIGNFSCCMFRTEIMQNLPKGLFEHRFNEIALSFYLDTIGPMGYLNEIQSLYRVHPAGVWSGGSVQRNLESGLIARSVARKYCAPRYREALSEIIRIKYEQPLRELQVTAKM